MASASSAMHLVAALHGAVLESLRRLPDELTALAGKRPAFIGIVIAITANIIISLALNVQKMAHIRLQQEQQRQQQEQHDAYDELDGSGEDEDDGLDDDYDSPGEGEGTARNRRLKPAGAAVETIQEESESPLPSARMSQHLTPGNGTSVVLDFSQDPDAQDQTAPPSPSPAPRVKLANSNSEQSGSSTEVDWSATPPSHAASKVLDVEQGDAGSDEDNAESRPLLSASRRSSSAPPPQPHSGPSTKFLRSRLWWCGIGLMTLGEAGNFVSYGFAPASLVAPLGAVALLSNVIIAPILLHERFRARDLGGIFLAIIGAVTVVYSSRQDDPRLGPDALWESIKRSIFLIYMAVVLSCGAGLAALSLTRLGDRFVLLDVGTCAIFGGFTVLSTKGISSMLSAGPSPFALFRYPITYALAFVLASTAVLQITFLNRALQRFDSRQVIPTMFTLFTIMAIVGSAVLYRDFEDMDAHRLINFLFGCGTTFAGVFLLTRRHDDDEQREPQEEQEGDDGRARREILEDVEEEEEGQVDEGVGDMSTLPTHHHGTVVAEPDALSIQSSAASRNPTLSDPALPNIVRRPVPEHSQSSPVPIAATRTAVDPAQAAGGIPIAVIANNNAGRRGRTATALDGTGTAFLAAGSPPGMVFALGNGVEAQVGASGPTGHSPALGGGVSHQQLGVGSAASARGGSTSAVTVPVTPARAGPSATMPVPAVSGQPGVGGHLLPLYRTPRISLIGSTTSTGAGPATHVGIVGPTPSASISALSAGQLLLLATPTPSAIPIAMGPSTSSHGHGYQGHGLARSLPGTHGGEVRSRALSQPSTPVPRRRSRRTLRADAAAQQQQQGGGRSGSASGDRADSRPRENYAKGQGSWTERRRPVSGLGLPSGSGYGSTANEGRAGTAGPGALAAGSASTSNLPQRRSVISLFGGWSGGPSTTAPTPPQPPANPDSTVPAAPLGEPVVTAQKQQPVFSESSSARDDAAGGTALPPEHPVLLRNNSAKTSPPALASPPAGSTSLSGAHRSTPVSPPRISSAEWSSIAAVPFSPPPLPPPPPAGAGSQSGTLTSPDQTDQATLSPAIPQRTLSLQPPSDAEDGQTQPPSEQ